MPMSQQERRGVIRATMARIGEQITAIDVNGELIRLGAPTVSDGTFYLNYRQVFGGNPTEVLRKLGLPGPRGGPALEEPAAPPPCEPSGGDWLMAFAKFASAVETVGGIERARLYLDEMERIKRL